MSRIVKIGRLVSGRDATACGHMGVWWPLFVELVRARLGVELEIIQAKGNGSKSAATHLEGTALDLRTWRFRDSVTRDLVRLAREAGAPATWFRTKAQGFDPHIHLVLDCGCRSGARYQITALKSGFNGLGRGGLGGKDDGPRLGSWRNYVSGVAWLRAQLKVLAVSEWEELIMGLSKDDLRALMADAVKDVLLEDLTPNKTGSAAVDGSRNNALWHAAKDRKAEVQAGVNAALWDPLVKGNDGVTGTSVRNVLLHIYATSVAALGVAREVASRSGVEVDVDTLTEGLPAAVADEVLGRLGAAITKA